MGMTRAWVLGSILLLTGIVYANSFPGAFHFDDFALLLDNPEVTGPEFRHSGFLEHYGGRPLTLWSFHWNHRLAGREPVSYHAVNVLLHALAAVAFFFAVRTLLRTGPGGPRDLARETRRATAAAWTAALVFAVHPLQTQAVNYIWSRSTLLMALFGLLAMAVVRRSPWPALMLLQLSVWSRTEGLVFVLPLLFLAPRRWRGLGLVAAANLAAFGAGLVRTAPQQVAWSHPDPPGYWLAQPALWWKYVAMMVFPWGQTVDHDVTAVPWWWTVAALAAWTAVGWAAWNWRGRHPSALLACAWVILFLAPSSLIPNTDWFNESRAYLATGGFAIVCGGAATAIAGTRWRNAAPLAAGVLLILLTGLTMSRNRVWNDDLLLWREAVRRSPLKARARYNLGFALAQRGQVELAEQAFLRARDLNPEDDLSYAALGYCAEVSRRIDEAREYYRRALRLRPDNEYALEGAARVGAPDGRDGAGGEGVQAPPNRPVGEKP